MLLEADGVAISPRERPSTATPQRQLTRLAWATVCLLSVALTGCASAQDTLSLRGRVTATATANVVTVPPIHTITLNGYVAAYIWPTAHGVLFTGNSGAAGQQIGMAGAPALYYCDDSVQMVRTVASASPAWDGTVRGIQDVVTAGDWVIYLVADAYRAYWEIWALNLASGQRSEVGRASGHSLLGFYERFVTDGRQVVWSSLAQAGDTTQHIMAVFDLATNQSRRLLTSAVNTFIYPEGAYGGAFVFAKVVNSLTVTGRLNPPPDSSLWLWNLADSAPTQIATTVGSATMNSHYIIWDDTHGNSLTLYNRTTGHETDNWVSECTLPVLGETRPDLACVDVQDRILRLVRLPSGTNVTLFQGDPGLNHNAVSGDRVYWLTTGQQIAWIEMPG